MKRFFATLVSTAVLTPSVAFSQQTNVYPVCYQYREEYIQGHYVSDGYYRPSRFYTTEYAVDCTTGKVYASRSYDGRSPVNAVSQSPVYYNQRRRVCNPLAGAALGAGLAGILGGNTRTNSGSYTSVYGKNYSSSSWSNTYQNGYSWQTLGAGIGALMFSC